MFGDGVFEFAAVTPVAVDVVGVHERTDRIEIGIAEADDLGDLLRVTRGTVGEAVRERCVDEAAVAPGACVRDAAGVDEEYVAFGIALLREQRGPQSGESAADDEQVGAGVVCEARQRCRCVGVVEPERGVGDIGEQA